MLKPNDPLFNAIRSIIEPQPINILDEGVAMPDGSQPTRGKVYVHTKRNGDEYDALFIKGSALSGQWARRYDKTSVEFITLNLKTGDEKLIFRLDLDLVSKLKQLD